MKRALTVAGAVLFFCAVTAGALYLARPNRWEPRFKAEVTADLELQMLVAGVGIDYVEPIAGCVASELERRYPEEKMRQIVEGRAALPAQAGWDMVRRCICDELKIPEARANCSP